MKSLYLLSAALLASLAANAAKPMSPMVEIMPESIQWGDAPSGLPMGAQGTLLEGNPGKPGYFAVRVKAPAGYKIMPHTHPGVERVTVLEGTVYLGMGPKWDESAMKAYPAGSYLSIPKGHQHYAYFKQPTTIQLNSLGPWGITYIDPKDDPRKKQSAKPSR
jgi:quercetin dioxygenase-like cupin family protein